LIDPARLRVLGITEQLVSSVQSALVIPAPSQRFLVYCLTVYFLNSYRMPINGAHWHLLVNHFPIVGTLLATLVLGYGLIRRQSSISQLSFGLFILMSIATLVANQTGESAEHYLKSIHALDRPRLHVHEEAADIANIGMYLTGLLSLVMLSWRRARQLRFLPLLIFILSLVTFGLMANVGRLGGLIMHSELRDESPSAIPTKK
jgi:uncharacterized membrane protein